MLSIVLLAMIGAMLDAGPAYWVIYGLWAACRAISCLLRFFMAFVNR